MDQPLIKGLGGAMRSWSFTSSTEEFRQDTLSTTNTEGTELELPTSPESPEETSLIFEAGKTTDFPQHYFLQLGEESLLGTGSSAAVRICSEIHTGETLACKIVFKADLSPEQRQKLVNEAHIHHFLSDHPHVVRLVDVCEDEECVYLIMEHCKGGDLLRVIQDEITESGSGLPEAKAAEIITCLAEFLSFIHEKGIVHRGLKPENLLLGEKYPENDSASIKVADFGNAFQGIVSDDVFHSTSSRRREFLGTHAYCAPEIMRGESYGTAVDVWSAGVILCNLLAGQMPFDREEYRSLVENRATLSFQRNSKWNVVPSQARHLIAGMLSLDPVTRITADEICRHPWILEHTKKRKATASRAALRKKLGIGRLGSRGSSSKPSVFACFGGSPN